MLVLSEVVFSWVLFLISVHLVWRRGSCCGAGADGNLAEGLRPTDVELVLDVG
jgi:hypothetical protein